MATKHDQIIEYIESLPIGKRISVRTIAKKLKVSEGTAYRAIKDAETLGLVSTIDRVGTIRVEKQPMKPVQKITYQDILQVTDGRVLGGQKGLNRHLETFIIGAMEINDIKKYLKPHALMIVGNRDDVQQIALEHELAVLITGGFDASQLVVDLANQFDLPLISVDYDSFTVASLINQSMVEHELLQDIVTVESIYTPIKKTAVLHPGATIDDFHHLSDTTGLSRFPVVRDQRLIGVVTAKDLIGRQKDTKIERVMTQKVVTAFSHMSVAAVSHKMTWEDIEMLPVIAEDMTLLGVVSRQDIMLAMQKQQQQRSILGNTYEDQIVVHLEEYPLQTGRHQYHFYTEVQPAMINHLGTISYGALIELISSAVSRYLLNRYEENIIIQQIDLYYFNLIQLANRLQFRVQIVHHSRRQIIVDVIIFHENTPVAKATLSCQIIEHA